MEEQETLLSEITKTEHSYLSATLGGFVAILLWSMTVAIARSLSEQIGPVTAAAAVYSVSGAAALFPLLRSNRKRRQILKLPLKYLIGCGVLFVTYMLLLFLTVGLAENHKQVLEVGLLNYLWPVLTLLLSLILLGKKASWILFPASLLAVTGIFMVVTQGAPVSVHSFFRNLAGNPAAYTLAFSAAVLWALYSNLTHKWAGGQKEGAVSIFLPVTAIILLLICCFLNEARQWNIRSVAETFFLGTATYFAYVLWDNAMRKGSIVTVTAASYLTPLLSTIVSCLYLSVIPESRLWWGCVILILGSFLSWYSVTYTSTEK
jgi:drug/metabolite transporter (DMT)-like permease